MLKKTFLAVLGLTASTLVAAGEMGPACVPGNVTVPCPAAQWDIGIEALYLQPLYGANRSYEPASLFNYFKDVDPDWGLGYRVQGGYLFSTGSDITGSWVHYDADSRLAPYVGNYKIVTTDSYFPGTYRQYIENRFDQVNLVMGQHADFGLFKNMRFFGGLQYAEIQVDATYYYNVPLIVQAGTFGVRTFNNTDYNGVGPVLGIDYSYDITPNFSLTANTAGSILYGSARLNRADVYGVGLVAVSDYASRHAVVPSVEARLGANYAYAIGQGLLNIEGGYQVTNYFNPLQSRSFGVCPVRTVSSADFGLYGPYLGVKWLGNG